MYGTGEEKQKGRKVTSMKREIIDEAIKTAPEEISIEQLEELETSPDPDEQIEDIKELLLGESEADEELYNASDNQPDITGQPSKNCSPDKVPAEYRERYKNIYNKGVNIKEWSEETRAEYGRRAAEVRKRNTKRRKEAKECLKNILNSDLSAKTAEEILGDGIVLTDGDYSVYNILWCRMVQVALAGDIKAAILVRDTYGDTPQDKVIEDMCLTDKDREKLDVMRTQLKRLITTGKKNGS